MQVYIPSYLGDVSLAPEGNNTELLFKRLTPLEEKAIDKFLKHYKMKRESPMGRVIIPETFDTVHKQFIKVFKAGRPVINAIKTKDGKMEIVQNFTAKEPGPGVTVEKPPRGCAMPIWDQKEAQAVKILELFLSPRQWADFLRQKAFIARGNHTGHPYLLTSRWNPSCEKTGLLYSLIGQEQVCASLLTVPPAEELLAMKISVECDELSFVGATLLDEFCQRQAGRR